MSSESAVLNAGQWEKVLLRTNAFLVSEVPMYDPFSGDAVSVDEELSMRHVQALDWSPFGLAKHGRSALAVLTTNHTLALYECVGRPGKIQSWERACIINNALRSHYAGEADAVNGNEQLRREQIVMKQRIRAFAWSPITRKSYTNDVKQMPHLDEQYLAVSNDCAEIIILRVRSPHELFSQRTAWEVTIVKKFDVNVDSAIAESWLGSIPVSHTRKLKYADQLAWSPWVADYDGVPTAVLAVKSVHQLHLAKVVVAVLQEEEELDVQSISHDRLRASGHQIMQLLRWAPYANNDHSLRLIACTTENLLCVDVSVDVSFSYELTQHHLRERWDQISGVTFCSGVSSSQVLHFTSHLSTPTAASAVLSLPFNPSSKHKHPLWQRNMAESEALYSAGYELDGHVQTRTWGIATSPLGDSIVTCTSMHPSDMVEYAIAADQDSVAVISRIGEVTMEQTAASFIDPTFAQDDILQSTQVSQQANGVDSSVDDTGMAGTLAEMNSEERTLVKQGTKTPPPEPAVSLARILFAAHDVCVYCGGKFVE
ncbi:hypothetical protein LTR66_011329 [Elasticomyces elasticus]|nr:hypothetical protein LTR66_011329 [Elasticomyces elasticus]